MIKNRMFSWASLLCFLCPVLGAAERPNLVLIIADDMNWDDCGAYGHPNIRTPNIDQLAKDGMRFDNAFLTASSCSPSRSSIITGRYPHNTDAEQLHWPLPAEQVTFVEKLKAAGYWTGAAGKWHLGDAMESRFDEVRAADTSGFQLPADGVVKPGVMQAAAERASGCDQWVSLLESRPKDKPFFLWLAALDPHRDYLPGAFDPPHKPSDIRIPPYMPDTPEVREDFVMYYDEIGRLDRYVGLVMAELEKQNVADNTVVMFISDNGRPFPRDKTTLYDGGIRTPLIVRWPGRVKSGSTTSSLASSVDLAPTFLEIADVPLPLSFEGRSFLPVLDDPTAEIRKFAFAEDHWHDFEDHARAVISSRYKLIRNDYVELPNTPPADAGRSVTFQAMLRLKDENKLTGAQLTCFVTPRPAIEFYDLEKDPFELTNLVAADGSVADSEVATSLKQHQWALRGWTERTKDAIPQHRTPDEFDRMTGKPLATRIRPRLSKAVMEERYKNNEKPFGILK